MIRRIAFVALVLLSFPPISRAQVIVGQSGQSFDRVRLAGLWWAGTLDGTIIPQRLEALPNFIDLGNLGLSDRESGWMGEVDLGLARRHRVRVVGSHRLNDGMTSITVNAEIGGIEFPLQVPVTSTLGINEFEAAYNFLFVANPAVDAGVLVGVGFFDATAAVSTPVGDLDARFDTPYPTLGGNMLVNPRGRFRAYVELTGFPKVTVDDFSGWKMGIVARAEMFITDSIGAYAGYRSYELDFRDQAVGDFTLFWNGFIVGAAIRF